MARLGAACTLLLKSPRYRLLMVLIVCLLCVTIYMVKNDREDEASKTPLDAANPARREDRPNMKHAEENLSIKKEEPARRQPVEPDDNPVEKNPQKMQKVDGGASRIKDDSINLYFALTNVHGNRRLQFDRYAKSLLKHTQARLRFHALVDKGGREAVTGSIPEGKLDNGPSVEIRFYDIDEIAKQAEPLVKPLKDHFVGSQRSYYSNPIFFVPVVLHLLVDESVKQLLVLDTDMEFRADVQDLANLFSSFSPKHIMGLAHEQQPVYRHVFHMYRNSHKGTIVGDPPPDGLTGFNSGVVLMHLERMRASKFYNQAIQGKVVKDMAEKYQFQGHLGDQDFYSLLSLEHSDLFFVLPCTWNRQLCTWWGDHGYKTVFSEYHTCEGKINLYHGNCNTPIPDTDT